MPFAAGVYTLPAGNPVTTNTTISSSWANTTLIDIGSALSTAVLKDGTQTMTANIPMAGFKFTGLGAGGSAGNSVRYEEVFTTGGVGFLGNIAVAGSVSGNLAVAGNVAVSGNVSVSGNLTVSGNTVFHGVTSTGATGTGNIVYATSPTVTSPVLNTGVSGTAIAGASDMSAATSSTLIVTPAVNRISLSTQQATTTGTAFDFVSIPSGTRRIAMMPNGVSTTGIANYLVQIGTATGMATSAYSSQVSRFGASVAASGGFLMTESVSTSIETFRGMMLLCLQDNISFTWVGMGIVNGAVTGLAGNHASSGSKVLDSELTQLRFTTIAGTSVFDAGTININFDR